MIPRSKGGKDEYKNYQLLHNYCHNVKTKRDSAKESGCNIEEPYDAKVSSTVLKPSHISDGMA
ncbi:MAG: HNH endonuclease [Microcoleaceae cyanobacterium MO_207.B10]|nr:HNH endonuclease [Microcoleaceae cyanobacterium MO_207.B10]